MLLRVVGSCSTVCIPLQQGGKTRNIISATMLGVVVPSKARKFGMGFFGGLFLSPGILGGVVGSLKDFVGF